MIYYGLRMPISVFIFVHFLVALPQRWDAWYMFKNGISGRCMDVMFAKKSERLDSS